MTVKVIDDIAFQTNLLAPNAAAEESASAASEMSSLAVELQNEVARFKLRR